jgi:hypothetical protein
MGGIYKRRWKDVEGTVHQSESNLLRSRRKTLARPAFDIGRDSEIRRAEFFERFVEFEQPRDMCFYKDA